MTDTTRDLIQRLTEELTNAIRVIHNEDGTHHISTSAPVLDEAHAYLAQPEPEGLTDEEILDLSEEHGVSYTTLRGFVIHPYQEVVDIKDYVLSFACALIAADRARWGRPVTQENRND